LRAVAQAAALEMKRKRYFRKNVGGVYVRGWKESRMCFCAEGVYSRSFVTEQVSFFREAATAGRHAADVDSRGMAASPRTGWMIVGVSGAAIALLTLLFAAVPIESIVRAPAVVQSVGGSRSVVATIPGVVMTIDATVGAKIVQGAAVGQIRPLVTAPLVADAERDVRVARWEYAEVTRASRFDEQRASIRKQLTLLNEQLQSLEFSVRACDQRALVFEAMVASGVSSRIQADGEREACEEKRRAVIGGRQREAEAHQELAILTERREMALLDARRRVVEAESRRDELVRPTGPETVLAPSGGLIDRLFVRPGDVVREGQVVARLIPTGMPLHVVAYVPEKYRASLESGAAARVELAQFPFRKYGAVDARITHVSPHIAAVDEVRDTVGEQQAASSRCRVELELVSHPEAVRLQPGMAADVRFRLRRQPLLAMILDR
jgi:multidrug efflux pump subunit AcrA (membrane-fusion protein)